MRIRAGELAQTGMTDGSVDSKVSLQTSRFGVLEYREEEVINFPEGLLGFAQSTRFLVMPNPTGGPLMWLQSVEDGKLAFIIADPKLFLPDYRVEVSRQDQEALDLTESDEGKVYTIMVVPPKNPRAMTANLQGPIVINTNKRLGRQVVLTSGEYTINHRVFQD